MTKQEFLEKMRHALANDLSGSVVQDNINYYDGYISDEVRKGRSEEAVIDELGDPWAIARTIIESVENTGSRQESYTYDPQQGYRNGQQSEDPRVRVIGVHSWWKRLLVILGILGIIMLVVAVVGGIFSLLAPIVVPLLIIIFIVRLIGGRGRR